MENPSNQQIIKYCQDHLQREGELEFNDSAIVSRCDEGVGAYVQAWQWVPFDELTDASRNPHAHR